MFGREDTIIRRVWPAESAAGCHIEELTDRASVRNNLSPSPSYTNVHVVCMYPYVPRSTRKIVILVC